VNRDPAEARIVNKGIPLQWPGYPAWKEQLPTLDYRRPRGPITLGTLAKHIARNLSKWIEVTFRTCYAVRS
jgi:hypothetical protein